MIDEMSRRRHNFLLLEQRGGLHCLCGLSFLTVSVLCRLPVPFAGPLTLSSSLKQPGNQTRNKDQNTTAAYRTTNNYTFAYMRV
jgi:hypothetical protein